VSALAGPRNDTRLLQITAPIQPGNSGGPVLNKAGQIVGLVTEKLNTLKVAELTGDIPQNVNFALKASVMSSFLENHQIGYQASQSGKKLSGPEISATGRTFTVSVESWP
jgi:S1-C subfamily serine protease